MKILFVYLATNPEGDEHLGTASIASFLEKRGIDVGLLGITYDNYTFSAIKIVDELPEADIVGFPLFSTNAKVIYAIAQELKTQSPQILVSVGGPLATAAAKEILNDSSYVDFVVLGDGEVPYLSVIEMLRKNQCIDECKNILTQNNKNIDKAQPYIVDINELPWVSRQYLRQIMKRGFTSARISAKRGCCANCSFCSFSIYTKEKGSRIRCRSVQDVYSEIMYLNRTYDIRSFIFNDGSFEDPGRAGKEWIKTFCELVRKSGKVFYFFVTVRAESFSEADKDLILLMKSVGFVEVFIGIESQNEDDLRFYKKNASSQDNLNAISVFKDCGIKVTYGFIMFNPIATADSISENYYFLSKTRCWKAYNYISRLDIDYATEMYNQCVQLGVLKENYSYMNTRAYNFRDRDVEQMWNFIEENLIDTCVYTRYDKQIYNISTFTNSLAVIFPEESEKYSKEVVSLLDGVSLYLSDFFYSLFVEHNYEKTYDNIPILEMNIERSVNKLQSIKFNMLMREPFRSYFLRYEYQEK